MQKNNLWLNSLLQSNKRIFTISSASLTTCVLSINDFYHVLIIRKLCGISKAWEVENTVQRRKPLCVWWIDFTKRSKFQPNLHSTHRTVIQLSIHLRTWHFFCNFATFLHAKQPKFTLRYYCLLFANFPCDERIHSF